MRTGTACLALIDSHFVSAVWEDLLYDGYDHEHGEGGLMLNSGSFGTHLEHDGDFPTLLLLDEQDRVVGVQVNLDPYREDLDSLRRPEGWEQDGAEPHVHSHDGHEHSHFHEHSDEAAGHGHAHGSHAEGWSTPEHVTLVSDTAVFGDPAGLPQADATGGLLDLVFPAAGGELTVSVLVESGVRRTLLAVWAAPTV